MGSENRDWAKWSDEERERFYGQPVEPAGTRSSTATWYFVVAGIAGAIVLGLLVWRGGDEPSAARVTVSRRDPPVVYGWRTVPPPHNPMADMSRAPRNALGGVDFVCTTRWVDTTTGRWVCGEYTIIWERGTRVVEPADPNATRAEQSP